jgi:3-phenylpropionate/trans-cinnamate dioxygenase ferredoxin component
MTDAKSYVRVAKVSDLSTDSSVAVEVGANSILVCHTNGRIFAVSNRCSHANEKLQFGRVRCGWVACRLHGARFDLESGRALSPPAIRPIITYPTRVSDDWIEVEVDTLPGRSNS